MPHTLALRSAPRRGPLANGYTGADPEFARFTQFDATARIGGFGPEAIMVNSSHSSYHALQTGANYNHARVGLNLQAATH
jgi:hypothetical protein